MNESSKWFDPNHTEPPTNAFVQIAYIGGMPPFDEEYTAANFDHNTDDFVKVDGTRIPKTWVAMWRYLTAEIVGEGGLEAIRFVLRDETIADAAYKGNVKAQDALNWARKVVAELI